MFDNEAMEAMKVITWDAIAVDIVIMEDMVDTVVDIHQEVNSSYRSLGNTTFLRI